MVKFFPGIIHKWNDKQKTLPSSTTEKSKIIWSVMLEYHWYNYLQRFSKATSLLITIILRDNTRLASHPIKNHNIATNFYWERVTNTNSTFWFVTTPSTTNNSYNQVDIQFFSENTARFLYKLFKLCFKVLFR